MTTFNPGRSTLERLKLLAENDEGLAEYLDAIEVTSPREREMMREISRTRPLAQPELFPQAHRNMAEALESLARHGYHGTMAGTGTGPLRGLIKWGVQLVRITWPNSIAEFPALSAGVTYIPIPAAGVVTLLFVIERLWLGEPPAGSYTFSDQPQSE